MRNTKKNRKEWLNNQFIRLQQGVDKKKLILSVNELNGVLSRKRKVVFITKWGELWGELWGDELWGWSAWEYYESIWLVLIRQFYPQLKAIKQNKKKIDAF